MSGTSQRVFEIKVYKICIILNGYYLTEYFIINLWTVISIIKKPVNIATFLFSCLMIS